MKGILLSTYVENISTRKDKSIKITLGTQEVSPSKAGELFSLLNHLATTYICPYEIDQKELAQVDKIDPELGGKTQSQRLRNVLFVMFEQNHDGFKEFDSFYKATMDKIIEHYKSKLIP